jgi:hypothetical protein
MRVLLAVAMLVFSSPPLAAQPEIEHFNTVSDCILPDPRLGILSYRVSNVLRVRIEALHRSGRVRLFYSQGGRTLFPSMAAPGVADPAPTADVEAYRLIATGEGGTEVSSRRSFRYRHAIFDLTSPARHLRATRGGDHLAVYEANANLAAIDALSCSFAFDRPIGGVTSRRGSAGIRAGPVVRCEVRWFSRARARAGGIVTWTARVTDQCTQGIITRTARVNPIP